MITLPEPTTLAESFQRQEPFPHAVLDHVLDDRDLSRAVADFPSPEWPSWTRFRDAYQREKLACSDILAMPRSLADLITELTAPRTLEFLERLTGIPRLVPDPYLEGGGLHCSGPGGVLAPHTDFHVYERLGLFRRLNVILYLNPGWAAHDGGDLLLYADPEATTPTARVAPIGGRLVVFRTDHESVHGFPEPVAQDRWRRSIALYYYTATDTSGFGGDTNTYWRHHAPSRGTGRLRFATYRALLFASKGFSHLAHRANPHFTPPTGTPGYPRERT